MGVYNPFGYLDGVDLTCGQYDDIIIPFNTSTGLTDPNIITPSCTDDLTFFCGATYQEYSKISENINYNEYINSTTGLYYKVDFTNTYKHIDNSFQYNCFNDSSIQFKIFKRFLLKHI